MMTIVVTTATTTTTDTMRGVHGPSMQTCLYAPFTNSYYSSIGNEK